MHKGLLVQWGLSVLQVSLVLMEREESQVGLENQANLVHKDRLVNGVSLVYLVPQDLQDNQVRQGKEDNKVPRDKLGKEAEMVHKEKLELEVSSST